MATSKKNLSLLFPVVFYLFLLSKPGSALPQYSTAHFAFASEHQSSLGAKNSTGSGYLLDVGSDMTEKIGLGIKTSALGFQSPGVQIYRLGAGPAAFIHINKAWNINISALIFHEMATNTQKTQLYKAGGQSLFLGWEHAYPIATGADFLLGGFIAGNMQNKLEASAAALPSKPQAHPAAKILFDRGVEIALRFQL